MGLPYSGALVASNPPPQAWFTVPFVDPGVRTTTDPVEQPADIFAPAPVEPDPAAIETDVWGETDDTPNSDYQLIEADHWADRSDPLPLNVVPYDATFVGQDRMVLDHSALDYRQNLMPTYKHASQGRTFDYIQGRAPQNAGEDVPEDMQYLVAGRNSYDFTNQPSDVYQGDRYRLGWETAEFGHYDYHTQQGQDAQLRSYEGQAPTFPVDKPPVANPTPMIPNSSGTQTWVMPQAMDVSDFAIPGEDGITDYSLTLDDAVNGTSDYPADPEDDMR